jgi:hypothetical protein
MAYSLEGYVDVAERIRQLREKHPNAVLRPWNPAEPFRVMEIGGREFIVYTAACYRTPDDPMPAVAVAAEPAIGKTNYTRDSEVMNAETSAWGRCIVACLAADTQRIASAQEVAARQADQTMDESRREHPANLAVVKPMSSAQPRNVPRNAPTGDAPITEKQSETLTKMLASRKVTATFADFASDVLGKPVETMESLSKRDASALISHLMNGETR